MHETTKALLEAVKEWRTTSAVLEVVGHWLDAGCPDLDAPEPDRLAQETSDLANRVAEFEARLDIHSSRLDVHSETFAKVSKRLEALDERVDAINNWVKTLNEQHALHGGELSDLRTSTASGLMRLTDRIKALGPVSALYERLTGLEEDMAGWEERLKALERPAAPPPPPPEPARFVPTEPGWYWYKGDGCAPYPRLYDERARLYDEGLPQPSVGWLAPVAPYAPPARTGEAPLRKVQGLDGSPATVTNVRAWDDKGNDISDRIEVVAGGFRLKPTRTAAEARANPMRGDRWQWPHIGAYTLVAPNVGELWEVLTKNGNEVGYLPGKPFDTYLGNFAHELEAP